MKSPTTAATVLEPLNSFVGVWDTEGEVKADPAGQRSKFTATDSYEWLPGGHFLFHRFDADMPEGRVEGIEIIGYSREDDSFHVRSFDNSGNETLMQARIEDGTWIFTGETTRFTGRFSEDGRVLVGHWEMRSGDGTAWQPWMDVRLTKVE